MSKIDDRIKALQVIHGGQGARSGQRQGKKNDSVKWAWQAWLVTLVLSIMAAVVTVVMADTADKNCELVAEVNGQQFTSCMRVIDDVPKQVRLMV